jgi:hypothetical protein
MALPKLNDTPKYNMVIPSTGQEVRFRPFLVKEEKVMLIAMESDDQQQQLQSIVDTLSACVQGDVNWNTLTTFDIELMFNKLRAKSVGETAKVGVPCDNEECKVDNEIVINVEMLDIKMPDISNVIQLDANVSIEMNWPSYMSVLQTTAGKQTETEQTFNLLRHCIKAVITENERIDLKNESAAEVDRFIESLNSEQFNKVKGFIDEMPAMKHPIEFTCPKCETENKQMLEGIQNFF